jgi:hypothetical protein
MPAEFRHGNLSEDVYLECQGDEICIRLFLNNIVVVLEQKMARETTHHWVSVP